MILKDYIATVCRMDFFFLQVVVDDYIYQLSSAIRNHMVTTFGKQTSM